MRRFLTLVAVVVGGAALLSGLQGCWHVQGRPAPPAEVFVVRHGESYGNLADRRQIPPEKIDTLTEQGVQQATALAKRLEGREFGAIYYSPTGRTRETAAILKEHLAVEKGALENPELASMRGGKGPDGKEVGFEWRLTNWARGEDPAPQGGESLGDAVARVKAQIAELVAQSGGAPIIIVTHSDICAGLAAQLQGVPFAKAYAQFHFKPADGFKITIDPATGAWAYGKL